MNGVLILLDSPDDWKPYCETSSVVTVSDYLKHRSFSKETRTVINLSNDYSYNSEGYYCSLLARTRGHKVIPGVDVINKMESGSGIRMDRTLQKLCYQWIQRNNLPDDQLWYLDIYFGTCREKGLEKIARYIFENYPCPLLRVGFNTRPRNQIETVQFRPLNALSDADQDFFADALDHFSRRVWQAPRSAKAPRYDLAILYDPDEKFPPSNKGAMNKFTEIARKMNIRAELITEEDAARLMEFDALLIRTTTSLNHYTYRLSQRAAQSGMSVIDDPLSIIRCTNKVYLKELFEREKVSAPASMLLFRSDEPTFDAVSERVGNPFVLKIPDGSFSHGMRKVACEADLHEALGVLHNESAILLAQEFIPTDFDWRIGILDGEPLFACKYFMAKGHWQIYHHYDCGRSSCGLTETIPIYQVPQNVLTTALKAASLIGRGLYGVDLKVVGGRAVVIEINDNPSIDHGIEDAVLGDELYYRILAHFGREVEMRYR